MPRVALIHALAESMAPITAELERVWPECGRMHLLDDSLSSDLARAGGTPDAAMTTRFLRLAGYAIDAGADAILFSCSAFGECIDTVVRAHSAIPVLKPNEAMIAEAARVGGRVGLIATFAPTLQSMSREFPASVELRVALADGALQALREGDTERHDALVADAARRLVQEGCDCVALAQFTMARATSAVERVVRVPVLSTVSSAVRLLRDRVERRQHESAAG